MKNLFKGLVVVLLPLILVSCSSQKKELKSVEYIDINKFIFETDICQICRKGELIPIDHEGIMVCNHCHKHIQYLVENEKPTYKEPPKEVCFYAYKRINHFME